jgi:hypothetical protein
MRFLFGDAACQVGQTILHGELSVPQQDGHVGGLRESEFGDDLLPTVAGVAPSSDVQVPRFHDLINRGFWVSQRLQGRNFLGDLADQGSTDATPCQRREGLDTFVILGSCTGEMVAPRR